MVQMISDQQKRKVKERALDELKRYAAIAVYLWVLFSMFEIHRYAVLRTVDHGAFVSGYRIGFAALNALIMGKVILIGEAFHLGERLGEQRIIYSVLFKSFMFALFAICCNVVEGVIVGLIHGTSIMASIPQMGGGGLEGMALYGIMAAIVLIPFFLFTEVQRLLGKDRLQSLILQKRSKADAA
jgi:hypothetical protein